MKTPYFITLVVALGLGFVFSQVLAIQVTAAGAGPLINPPVYLPLVVAHPQADPSGLIIDHTSTDLSKIPDAWLEQAKKLTLHYAFTSHGSQLLSGLAYWEGQDPKYAFTAGSGVVPQAAGAGLRIYEGTTDGSHYESYAIPELYWASPDGIQRTRAVADTGLFGYSMWAWCGQQSSNDAATVERYLAQMSAYEAAYPGMRFILMTGHTDGSGPQGTLNQNNNRLREYARQHNMVLFDFADIESYAPDGTYYPGTDDSCPWCQNWCAAHPDQCQDLPGCAHSHGFNCVQKGKAFWWMMARLAGWDGN